MTVSKMLNTVVKTMDNANDDFNIGLINGLGVMGALIENLHRINKAELTDDAWRIITYFVTEVESAYHENFRRSDDKKTTD